jgi:hypothetical protein
MRRCRVARERIEPLREAKTEIVEVARAHDEVGLATADRTFCLWSGDLDKCGSGSRPLWAGRGRVTAASARPVNAPSGNAISGRLLDGFDLPLCAIDKISATSHPEQSKKDHKSGYHKNNFQ